MKTHRVRILAEVHDKRRCLFSLPASSAESSDAEEIEPRHPFLKKLENSYQAAMRAIQNADKGLLLWLSQIIHYLESKVGPEEGVLKAVRKADVIEIAYPPQCQEKWVRRLFRRFVNIGDQAGTAAKQCIQLQKGLGEPAERITGLAITLCSETCQTAGQLVDA